MERIKELSGYKKGLLIFLIAAVVIFTVVYSVFSPQIGYVYKDTFLEMRTEGENTVYTGRIKGVTAEFTVGADKSVIYHYGEKTYGPYTAKKDPTAVPEENGHAANMVGVEIREGEKVFFRGGVLVFDTVGSYMVYDENGIFYSGITVSSNGVMYDENGQIIDPDMPTVNTILYMMSGPELTRRVSWGAWFGGVFLALVTAISILFALELFRFRMLFVVENAEDVYPSEWETASLHIGWTVAAFVVLYLFFSGIHM